MIVWNAIKQGLKKAFKLSLKICKIIIPVRFVVAILEYIGVLEKISIFFEGFMGLFGLPGKTALTFLLSNGVNIYAGIAALPEEGLGAREITILATMICISHSLVVETSVLKSLNIPRYLQILFRMGISIIVGILMNFLWR